MKKLLYVLLAMTMAFAMIGCPTDGDDDTTSGTTPTGPVITITGPASVAPGETGTYTLRVDNVAVTGTVTWTVTPTTGGSSITNAGVLSVGATETAASLTITATLDSAPTTTATRSITVAGVNITFTAYPGATPVVVMLPPNVSFDVAGKAVPAPGVRPGFRFYQWEDADEVAIDKDSSFAADTAITGVWYADTLTDPDNRAQAKVALENAARVLVKFNVPANINWANYTGIEVETKISEATAKLNNIRLARLQGVYVETDISSTDMNGVKVAKFDDKNAAFILDDLNGSAGVGTINSTKSWNLLGYTAPDEWFTITYKIDGSRKNSGHVAANLPGGANNVDVDNTDPSDPVTTSKTPVYFGVGVPGENADGGNSMARPTQAKWDINANVQLIGKVTLKGNPAVPEDTEAGTPAIPAVADIQGTLDFDGAGALAYAGNLFDLFWSWGSKNINDTPAIPVPAGQFACPCDDKNQADCECGGYDCDCHVTVVVTEPLILTKIIPGSYGSNPPVDADTGTVTISSNSSGGMGFYYRFIENDSTNPLTSWNAYTSVEITYTATITTAPAKVIVKKGADSWADTDPKQYLDVEDGVGKIWTIPTASLAGASTPGVSFQVNNGDTADNNQEWTFQATQIRLIP